MFVVAAKVFPLFNGLVMTYAAILCVYPAPSSSSALAAAAVSVGGDDAATNASGHGGAGFAGDVGGAFASSLANDGLRPPHRPASGGAQKVAPGRLSDVMQEDAFI